MPTLDPALAHLVNVLLSLFLIGVLLAWVVWSLKRLQIAIADVRRRWGDWDTYPVPDKRATWNLAALLAIIAVWCLLTAGIVFWLRWAVYG